MSTLTTRRPRVKTVVPRTLRLDADTATLTITMTTSKKVAQTDYSLERIGSDFGDGFRLTKHVGHPADDCDIYNVHVSNEGHTCECLGHLRHHHCKHVDAVVKLREL